MATRATREITQRLMSGRSGLDRRLEEIFLRARRQTRRPLALVSRTGLLTNAAATRLLDAADQPRLWEFASRCLSLSSETDSRFTLRDGNAVAVHLEAVWDGNDASGVLIRFPKPSRGGDPSSVRLVTQRRKAYGWDSLTEAEHSVTNLVANGLTNRQIANKLWKSRYTVDAHLRHIFRKLGINSRVELVRIATEQSLTRQSDVDAGAVA